MNEDRYEHYHRQLPERIRAWLRGRGISDEVIDRSRIGWNGRAITIPIFDRSGGFVFFRYRKDPDDQRPDTPKYWCDQGSSPELYGWEHVNAGLSPLVICEGELDRLVLESRGFAAVTSTGGAGVFKTEWARAIAASADVYICFDNDTAGRMGAAKVAELLPRAKIVLLPHEVGEGGDITDFFVPLGKETEDFEALLAGSTTLEHLTHERSLLLAEGLTAVNPSQEFLEDWGCFAIPLTVPAPERSAKPLEERLLLVASDGRMIDATDRRALYQAHRLLLADIPQVMNPELRWEYRHILQYSRGFTPSPAEAFQRIRDVYERHIEFPDEEWYGVMALWVMGTYLFRIFEAYPYLAFSGIKNTGKSKTLELTSRLGFNGISSVGISEASLFRLVAGTRGAIAFDEAELLHDRRSPRAQGIRELLNAGHRKGTFVYRQGKDRRGEFVTRRFEVYSPKLLASIAGLEDVLASRAITLVMLRARSERGRTLITDSSEDWPMLRHLLYSFALRFFRDVRDIYRNDPNVQVSNNRATDLWSPLLALARVAFADEPGAFTRLRRFALRCIGEAHDENLDDLSAALLQVLDELVKEDRLYTNQEIAEGVQAVLDDGDRDEMRASAVGYRLRRFGLRKQRTRNGTKYFIRRKDMDDLLARYLPDRETPPDDSPEGPPATPSPPVWKIPVRADGAA